MVYEISRALRLEFNLPGDSSAARFVESALDPWGALPAGGDTSDVRIDELTEQPHGAELQNPAGDALSTAIDAGGAYVRANGLWCAVPPPALEGPFVFAAQRGFPLSQIFGRFVRPALQLAAGRHNAVAVHGSAVVADGHGIVVAGWSETGKTETALALVEEGATFLSDKWTLVFADGSLACFPITIGVRRWLLRYAPTLRRRLPRAARLQFAAAAAGEAAARVTAPLARRGGVVAATHAAAAELATLAQRASLSPSQLSAAYGQPPPTTREPLGALVVLTTTLDGQPQAEPRDPAWAARRLARSAAYERRDYLTLAERARYIRDGEGADISHLIEDREERHLASVLASARVIEARAPFPTDPRRIVDAVRPLL
ncbi:MAG TPA: hypothetical protein VFL58_05900 [Gaiellaceae bacterium]|nr:hypothetical protein [Gaiellaceae bacterium]